MKKIILFLITVVVFTLVTFVLFLPTIGKRDDSFYYELRKETLEKLRDIVVKTNSSNLDDAFNSLKTECYKIPIPYTFNCPSINVKNLCKKEYFEKYVRYRIIKTDNWWGIIELEYGIIGKYFLLITEKGKIIKIKEPFLPEQMQATYPPAMFKEKIDLTNIPALISPPPK